METWEALGPGLTSKLTLGVTGLTLNFRPMLAVSDGFLRSTHTGALLSALAEVITITCLNLSEFSVSIDTTRNEERGDNKDDLEGHTTDEQWRAIEQIIGFIIKVVDEATNLSTLDITVVLNDLQEFLPHVIRSQRSGGLYNLTTDLNMLNLVKGKRVVNHNKELFRVILTKASISSITIRMLDLLPTLVGALQVMAEGTKPRHYDPLNLKFGDACTVEPGCPPYWEGFGNPFTSIIKFAQWTRAKGLFIVSMPPEILGNPTLLREPEGVESGETYISTFALAPQ